MPKIRIHPPWHLPESAATPEAAFLNRRDFLRTGAAAAAGALLLPSIGCADDGDPLGHTAAYPGEITRNPKYTVEAGRKTSDAKVAASFNNFYEFTTNKSRVWRLVDKFKTKPWQIEIAGLCKKTGTFDLDDILKKMPQEERLYRFRCVEAWAMVVPWIGFPMKKLLDWVEPNAKAKFVRFDTAWKPAEMPTVDGWREKFPYYEALRMDEAANELTLLGTGMYGRTMPKQNGAPIRMIVPWKYGYKSGKSIVKITFVEKQPRTFWNDIQPLEYGFYSNVNPNRPHPRWSQATEWRIPNEGKRFPTAMFNGYGEQVAALYKGMDLIKNH